MLSRLRPLGIARHGVHLQTPIFRPALLNRRIQTTSRLSSAETGEEKTGHISEGSNQAILYFDNVYPLRLSWLLALPWGAEQRLEKLVDNATSPHAIRANPLHILRSLPGKKQTDSTDSNNPPTEKQLHEDPIEVFPRLKEGGAFVKVTLPVGEDSKELEQILRTHLKESQIKPWWNPFERVRARLVKGKPWVEDLYRMPSSRLKVQFLPGEPGSQAVELPQEALYEFFRPYGKLLEITPQASDSKELPRYALVDYQRVRRAAMAKNCLHGVLVPESHGGGKVGTLIKVGYEQKIKHHWIKDWIFSHPRIVIPIIAALIATISIAIFDPYVVHDLLEYMLTGVGYEHGSSKDT
jgi:hypothetical protein